MHREPEWDDYTRAEAMAFEQWLDSRCPRCGGAVVAYVPVKDSERDVHWDGRTFRVDGVRCLNCMAVSIIERDASEVEKDLRPVRGTYLPSDGRTFISRETTDPGGR